VVQDESALNSWVDTALSSVLRSAPGAVAVTKALLAALPERTWSEGLTDAQARSAELFAGAEAAEGMEAFLRKRKPSWDVTGS
jgi:enoyl-CoA hydratase/carnithine racemase